MKTIALLVFLVAALLLLQIVTAPEGFETKDGFFYGQQNQKSENKNEEK